MTKEYTMTKVRIIASEMLKAFEESKGSLKLKGKALYNLIGLKKEFEKILEQIQETLVEIAKAHGGTPSEDGKGYSIPEDQQEIVNKKIIEFSEEIITIQYDEIFLSTEDEISASLADAIFDFLKFED